MHPIIQQNLLLLLGIFMALFAYTLGLYNNPIIAAIHNRNLPVTMFTILKHPWAAFVIAQEHRRIRFLFVVMVFIILSLILSFVFLLFNYSFVYAMVGVIPMTLLIILFIYYLIWITTYVMNRIIDVGNIKFNVMFSLVSFELIVVYIVFMIDESAAIMAPSTFAMAFAILIFCYILTCTAMRMVLRETTLNYGGNFSHHNLWKVAVTLLLEFLLELTFLCYLGFCYFTNAYSHDVTLFDLFYYIVISFGTVGYGDITPTCTYTKLMAIITTITSIACIGIMLSSFLSASRVTARKK